MYIADQNSLRKSSSVVVLFEGPEERETAVTFCDRLIERFWAQCAFDVHWWSFDSIAQTEEARRAHNKALHADLVVFAPGMHNDIPIEAKAWTERWLRSRSSGREGSVVCLLPQGLEPDADERLRYLRDVARRARMDFLTRIPDAVEQLMPDSLDSYSQRAQHITGVLDEILHQPGKPALMHS